MAITFNGSTKIITLDKALVSASEIWIAWCDWIETSDNSKWPIALRQVGGDSLGGDLYIPPYIFLMNGWKVRPMEQNHDLVLTGNLFVEGGGIPVVRTIGNYQVNVNYTVPVQAQALNVSGGTSGPTADQIKEAILNALLTDFDNDDTIGGRLKDIINAAKIIQALSA